MANCAMGTLRLWRCALLPSAFVSSLPGGVKGVVLALTFSWLRVGGGASVAWSPLRGLDHVTTTDSVSPLQPVRAASFSW